MSCTFFRYAFSMSFTGSRNWNVHSSFQRITEVVGDERNFFYRTDRGCFGADGRTDFAQMEREAEEIRKRHRTIEIGTLPLPSSFIPHSPIHFYVPCGSVEAMPGPVQPVCLYRSCKHRVFPPFPAAPVTVGDVMHLREGGQFLHTTQHGARIPPDLLACRPESVQGRDCCTALRRSRRTAQGSCGAQGNAL